MRIVTISIYSITALFNFIGPLASATNPPCPAPCVPFNVANTKGDGDADLQPEYTDCTTKQIKKVSLEHGKSDQYCVAANSEVRIEKPNGWGSTSNVWGPTPAGAGWNLECIAVYADGVVSCNGTPLKPQNCRNFTVQRPATLVGFPLQPEYTECISKRYIKARLEAKSEEAITETYTVEAGTDVRIERPWGPWSSTNVWGPKNIGNGLVVNCPTEKSCTDTSVK